MAIERLLAAGLAAIWLGGCGFSPLMNQLAVGEIPIIIMVGEASNGHTELFASHSAGGQVTRLTYTPHAEWSPKLAGSGGLLLFLRQRTVGDTSSANAVVMNLLSGNERLITLPEEAGRPLEVAWALDESTIFIRTANGTWQVTPPPGNPAPSLLDPVTAAADSAFTVVLGEPHFAVAAICGSGELICVTSADGSTLDMGEGHSPFRWGTDSLAWFAGSDLYVRSLGPGSFRRVEWSNPPLNPRSATYDLP